MAQKLSRVRIIIFRKCGQLFDFSDIMENSGRDQKIPVELRIIGGVIIAELGDAQRVLQKPSHKAVMHGLGRGVELERLGKCLIVHKIKGEQLVQIRIFHALYESKKLLIHLLDILLGDRKIIRLHILPFPRLADPAHIQLMGILEKGDVRLHVHIVHGLKLAHARGVQIPDLRVDGSRLVLQHHISILLAALRQRDLLALAQIHIPRMHAFPEALDIFHFQSFLCFLQISYNNAARHFATWLRLLRQTQFPCIRLFRYSSEQPP